MPRLDIPPEPIKGVLVNILLKWPPQHKGEVSSFAEPPLGADGVLEYRKVTRLGIEPRPSGHIPDALTTELSSLVVELGLCNLSLEFSLAHVVVAESSFG